MEKKKQIERLLSTLLQEANDEELDVLLSALKGVREKQSGKYPTYLAALTQVEAHFLPNGDFEMTMPIQPIVHNPLQMVHGGITATLLDTAMGWMITKKLPEHLGSVTAELKVNYIKPGVGKQLRCVATLLHQGKHLCFAEAKVYSDNNEIIASASGTFFIFQLNKN